MVNHVLTVREDVLESYLDETQLLYELFRGAVAENVTSVPPAGDQWAWARDVEIYPLGFEAMRPTLRRLADEVYQQQIVAEPMPDSSLAHPVVMEWA